MFLCIFHFSVIHFVLRDELSEVERDELRVALQIPGAIGIRVVRGRIIRRVNEARTKKMHLHKLLKHKNAWKSLK